MRTVVPSVSEQNAIELLTSRTSSFVTKLTRKPANPTRTELLYLPYHCFQIELSSETEQSLVRVAVDGLVGEGVFFIGETLETEALGGEQRCDFELSASEAKQIALDQYRRMLLEHGLRNKTKASVESVSEAEQILYPFWIGYVRKGGAYDFNALDAVSGEVQGMRMRKVFLRAFRQLEAQ